MRPTVDSKMLFVQLRHIAYQLHHDFDDLQAFENHLHTLAIDWLESSSSQQKDRSADRPAQWPDADYREVERTARKIAHWTWERMRQPSTPEQAS